MKKQNLHKPFFSHFLEHQLKDDTNPGIRGGKLTKPALDTLQTEKYPSDSDEYETHKYPSDSEDDNVTHKFPSDSDEDVTMKYPSDGEDGPGGTLDPASDI